MIPGNGSLDGSAGVDPLKPGETVTFKSTIPTKFFVGVTGKFQVAVLCAASTGFGRVFSKPFDLPGVKTPSREGIQ